MNAKVYCDGTRIRCLHEIKLTVSMSGAPVEFDFSSEWDGLGKTAVFTCDGTKDVILDAEGKAVVPHEILTTPGMDVVVGVYAVREDGTTWPAPTPLCRIGRVETGADPSGDESYPPAPDVGEQAVAAASKALEAAAEAQEVAADIQRRADAGEFDGKDGAQGEKGDKGDTGATGSPGEDGEDGGYYTPTVTQPDDATMRVNFTPSKSGMASVSAVDVTLPSGGSGGITQETDPTVPAWAKAPEKPSYTAEEVGALPVGTEIPVVPTKVTAFDNDAGYLTEHQDLSGYAKSEDIPTTLPNPHKLTFSGAVSAEYDGSEAVEVVIPQGGGGGGIPLPATAEVGQYFKVSSVDENGIVTAVEAVDAPSGGGEEWRLIYSATIEEAVARVDIFADSDGNEFYCRKLKARVGFADAADDTARTMKGGVDYYRCLNGEEVLQGGSYGFINLTVGKNTNSVCWWILDLAVTHDNKTAIITKQAYNYRSGAVAGPQLKELGNYKEPSSVYYVKDINNFTVICTDNTIPAGSTIKIWGVDA